MAKAYDIPFRKTSDYEDFETNVINSLQIRENDTDPGSIYGSGNNRYIIDGNFLLYGKTTIKCKISSVITDRVSSPMKKQQNSLN